MNVPTKKPIVVDTCTLIDAMYGCILEDEAHQREAQAWRVLQHVRQKYYLASTPQTCKEMAQVGVDLKEKTRGCRPTSMFSRVCFINGLFPAEGQVVLNKMDRQRIYCPADDKDSVFLQLALKVNAAFLISTDRHLTQMKKAGESCDILSPIDYEKRCMAVRAPAHGARVFKLSKKMEF